jgi:hypothetical protein
MRARLSSIPFLAVATVFAILFYGAGMRGPARLIMGIPFFGATGLWLLVFGYPKRADGLAPVWWRLGLVGCVVVLTAGTALTLD